VAAQDLSLFHVTDSPTEAVKIIVEYKRRAASDPSKRDSELASPANP
jgi:hypothetical protein